MGKHRVLRGHRLDSSAQRELYDKFIDVEGFNEPGKDKGAAPYFKKKIDDCCKNATAKLFANGGIWLKPTEDDDNEVV